MHGIQIMSLIHHSKNIQIDASLENTQLLVLTVFNTGKGSQETYASDFPSNTTGGATAENTQKRMWNCNHRKFKHYINVHLKLMNIG